MIAMTFKNVLFIWACFFVVLCTPHLGHSNHLSKGTNLHHMFPEELEKKYQYFSKHQINHHMYTIPLTQKVHSALHNYGGGNWYNKEWLAFRKLNPSTDRNTIFAFAGVLVAQAGVTDVLDLYNHKTRKPTGEKFNPKSWANKFKKAAARTASKRLQRGGKALKKIVRPVQYIITIYESGKVVKKYIDTGEVDLEKAAEAGVRIVGGYAGSEVGGAIGCVACTPAIASGPGYLVCVVIFTIGGGILGDEVGGQTAQFIVENKEVIEERLHGAYKEGRAFSDSIVNYDVFKDNKYWDIAFQKRKEAIALQIEGKRQESEEMIGDAFFYFGFAIFEKGMSYRTKTSGKIVDILTNESEEYFKRSDVLFRRSIKWSPENSMTYYFLADTNLMLKNYKIAREYYNRSIYYFRKDNRTDWVQKARKKIKIVNKEMS